MPLGGLSDATVVFVEHHLEQEVRAVRHASPTAVTLKQGHQIEFLIDQAVDLAGPMVGIELAVKSLPVGRFGRPRRVQKTTEERLWAVVDFSTISIRVTSCRTHGLKSIGENANSSQPAGGHFFPPSISPIRRKLSCGGGSGWGGYTPWDWTRTAAVRLAAGVQGHRRSNQRLQRLLVRLVALTEIDRAPVLPSRLELKRPEGSSSEAPLAKVIFTAFL